MTNTDDRDAAKQRSDRLHSAIDEILRKKGRLPGKAKEPESGDDQCPPKPEKESPRDFIRRRMSELDDDS